MMMFAFLFFAAALTGSAADPLVRAVSAPVLPADFANSSESLALAALAEADAAVDWEWERIGSAEEMSVRQRRVRAAFLASLGGFPDRTSLNVKTTGTILGDGYRIEKVLFESQPGFYVTANVYVPDAGAAPHPAILVPLGHTPEGKAGPSYQRMAILGVRAGFVVLLYDPIDQGERVVDAQHAVAKGHNKSGALAYRLGWNFGRLRAWDGIRALDYLASRPDVDGKRLCVCGTSGGGTLTSLVMSLDERVVAAAPSCYISAINDVFRERFPSDSEQEQFGELAFGLNHLGYLFLRAPMPTLVNCMTDDFFPYAGTVRTLSHARSIAARLGWGDRLASVRATGPHSWPEDNQRATLAFFARWVGLKEQKRPETPETYRIESELAVAPGGSVTNIPGYRKSDDLFREELVRLERQRAQRVSAARVAELARIRLTDRPKCDLRVLGSEKMGEFTLERLSFRTPDGAQLPAVLLLPAKVAGAPVVICGESGRADRLALAREKLAAGRPVLLPDLCGWGEIGTIRRKFFDQAVADEGLAMMWYPIGRTLVGIRAENLLDIAAGLKTRFGDVPDVVAIGRAAIPAVHARYVAPEQSGAVEEIDPPRAWSEEVCMGLKCNFADGVHGALAAYDWVDLRDPGTKGR